MSKSVDEAVLGTRIGHYSDQMKQEIENSPKVQGLLLSQIVYKPIDFFIPNPCNTVFDALKTEQQFDALLKDIDEARAILNPLIAMPDGTVIEGHSRLNVAKKLQNEGKSLGLLPVRIITTPLTDDEIKQRVYLGNLLRFEIDEDTRISLYAEIWPGYFYSSGNAGRKSDHGDTITASELSQKLNKSIPQIKRDASIFRKASKRAGGRPSITDIKHCRTEINEERRQKATMKKNPVAIADQNLTILEDKLIESLKINDKWDLSLNITQFYEYSNLLHASNKTKQGLIINYLLARICMNEQHDTTQRS